ncbi:MAG: serine/threonine-protein kinase [Thermoanaerobaculia bacterium]
MSVPRSTGPQVPSDPPGTGWRHLRDLLACELELPAGERPERLRQLEIAQPAIARELADLLRADAVESSFLDRAASPVIGSDGDPASGGEVAPERLEGVLRPPARLGPWRIHEQLGQGGMGTVYRAERADGAFEQDVAIKILRRSVDTPDLQRRFLRERQLLAQLDHPAIVKIIDGGVGPEGLPWFALERVAGLPITRFAADGKLSTRHRVRLLRDVCAAVDAAHRRLVVHRDLKPSNLLVTPDGRVKLLDFGIAKVLEVDEGEALTQAGSRLLTPQYAAPEQILGEPVTTAVDVYALGVVLYELLAGAVPFERATTTPAGLALEVANETLIPPSRRLLAECAMNLDSRRRAREVTGDLDAIVMKALRPEPAERYASVAALAADLERHLLHLPVEARSGNRRYRFGRFARRHRGLLAGGAGLALTLFAGISTTLYEARVARGERDAARVQAETSRRVSEFMAHLFQQADPARTRGALLTAREVLAAGATHIERDLAGDPKVQASLLLAIGAVDRDLGLFDEARPLLERALDLRRRNFGPEDLATAEAQFELGSLDRYLDKIRQGRELLSHALAIRERELGPRHLEVARAHSALGILLRFDGDSPAARREFESALAIAAALGLENEETGRWQNSYGLVLADVGDNSGAESSYRRSIDVLQRTAGADNPLLALPLDNLGMLLRGEERFGEAEPPLRRALALVQRTWGEHHVQFGTALNSLGTLLMDSGRCPEAIPLLRRAVDVYTAALGPEHRFIAYPLISQGDCEMNSHRPSEALTVYRRALALRAGAHPDGEDEPIAEGRDRVGTALLALGKLEEAEEEFRQALAISRRNLEPASPPIAEHLMDLADCLERAWNRHGRAGGRELVESRADYTEALGIFRHLYPAGHTSITRATAALARLELRPLAQARDQLSHPR